MDDPNTFYTPIRMRRPFSPGAGGGGGGDATITDVGSMEGQQGDFTEILTITGVTAGDLLVCWAYSTDASAQADTAIAITDNSGGGSWTKIAEVISATAHVAAAWARATIWTKIANGSETQVTNTTSGDSFTGLYVHKFQSSGTFAVDDTATTNDATGNPCGPGSIDVNTASGLVLVGGVFHRPAPTVAAPFNTENVESTTTIRFNSSWNIYTGASGTKDLSGVYDFGNTTDYVAATVSIKATS
jgi:hypothetical protein